MVSGCKHHWILSDHKPVTNGTCKYCGETRVHGNPDELRTPSWREISLNDKTVKSNKLSSVLDYEGEIRD